MADKKVRFVLCISVLEIEGHQEPIVQANTQVWTDGEHYTTISLIDYTPAIMPDESHLQTVESWSANASRVVARMIDEKLFESISSVSVHRRDDYS